MVGRRRCWRLAGERAVGFSASGDVSEAVGAGAPIPCRLHAVASRTYRPGGEPPSLATGPALPMGMPCKHLPHIWVANGLTLVVGMRWIVGLGHPAR